MGVGDWVFFPRPIPIILVRTTSSLTSVVRAHQYLLQRLEGELKLLESRQLSLHLIGAEVAVACVEAVSFIFAHRCPDKSRSKSDDESGWARLTNFWA